jgi:hypothetical protein
MEISIEVVERLRSTTLTLKESIISGDKLDKVENVIELCDLLLKNVEDGMCVGGKVAGYLQTVNEHLFYIQNDVYALAQWCVICEGKKNEVSELVKEVSDCLHAKL